MQQELQQFEKLWQIFDDAVKTGKYKSIPKRLTDGKDGRCANGLILSYTHPELDINPETRSLSKIEGVFCELYKKFGIHSDSMSNDIDIYNQKDDEELIRLLKEQNKLYGSVNQTIYVILNNRGYNFTHLRDIFKEMDV